MTNIYDNFRLIRPIPQGFNVDNIDGIPTIKKENLDIDWDNINFGTFSNIASFKNKENVCLSFFQYDKTFERVWNNPEKYISLFKEFGIVVTPDFSTYCNMAPVEIGHNIF